MGNDYGKYAQVERERRMLLRELPPGLERSSDHLQITDNYITGTRLRLRKIRVPSTHARVWTLTQKFTPAPHNYSHSIMTNIYLSEYEYEVFSVFESNEIRKNRYPYKYEDRVYGIDFFLGDLLGLILAETNFETDEEMVNFVVPPFAVADVTDDEMFSGGKLVTMTSAEIRAELQRRREGESKETSEGKR